MFQDIIAMHSLGHAAMNRTQTNPSPSCHFLWTFDVVDMSADDVDADILILVNGAWQNANECVARKRKSTFLDAFRLAHLARIFKLPRPPPPPEAVVSGECRFFKQLRGDFKPYEFVWRYTRGEIEIEEDSDEVELVQESVVVDPVGDSIPQTPPPQRSSHRSRSPVPRPSSASSSSVAAVAVARGLPPGPERIPANQVVDSISRIGNWYKVEREKAAKRRGLSGATAQRKPPQPPPIRRYPQVEDRYWAPNYCCQ